MYIWWKTHSQSVLAPQVPIRDVNPALYTFDIPSQTLTDVTEALRPCGSTTMGKRKGAPPMTRIGTGRD